MRCSIVSRAPAACVPFTQARPRTVGRMSRYVRVAGAAEDAQAEKMRALEEAMKTPAVAAQVQAMEEQMKTPEVQNQLANMNALMSNPQYLQKMAELREDPELKPYFDEMREGGMAAMMKYMSDATFLGKIGEKMGDLESLVVESLPPSPAVTSAAPPPVVNNILDAAKYGDIEAIEDYMAIGKGDLRDENQRSALHYAVAYNQGGAAKALLDNGADVCAVDDAGNTPLHFAAGYGRAGAVRGLVDVGADINAKNSDGKTAAELIRGEPRNPLNNDTALLEGKSA